MFCALKKFSRESLITFAASNFDVRAIDFQVKVEILNSFESFVTIFAYLTQWTCLLNMVIKLKDFHLNFNLAGRGRSFFALWIVRIGLLRLFLTKMSFGHVLDFLQHFFGDFANFE